VFNTKLVFTIAKIILSKFVQHMHIITVSWNSYVWDAAFYVFSNFDNKHLQSTL